MMWKKKFPFRRQMLLVRVACDHEAHCGLWFGHCAKRFRVMTLHEIEKSVRSPFHVDLALCPGLLHLTKLVHKTLDRPLPDVADAVSKDADRQFTNVKKLLCILICLDHLLLPVDDSSQLRHTLRPKNDSVVDLHCCNDGHGFLKGGVPGGGSGNSRLRPQSLQGISESFNRIRTKCNNLHT